MVVKNGIPYCDHCRQELKAWTEEEALEAEPPCGWSNWKTATNHYCHPCADIICEDIRYPPCEECETHPCERGRECWANPPLHIFPYETFYGETLLDNSCENKFGLEEPIEDDTRKRQKRLIAAHEKSQTSLDTFLKIPREALGQ